MNEDPFYEYVARQLYELTQECQTASEKRSFVRVLRDLLGEIDSLERARAIAELGSALPHVGGLRHLVDSPSEGRYD